MPIQHFRRPLKCLDSFGKGDVMKGVMVEASYDNGNDNKVIARLGDDVEGVVKQKNVDRGKPKTWVNGKFVHPHDACFDNQGNIIVAEWVATGRVSRLKKVS